MGGDLRDENNKRMSPSAASLSLSGSRGLAPVRLVMIAATSAPKSCFAIVSWSFFRFSIPPAPAPPGVLERSPFAVGRILRLT